MQSLSFPLLAATLLCLLSSPPSFAQDAGQDATYTPTPPKERNIQVSLDLPGSSNNQDRLTASLAYQWKARRWMYLKAGVFYGSILDGHRDDYSPVAADTLLHTKAWQQYRVGGLTLGVESRRHFYKALSMVAGLDALLGYGTGKAIYTRQYLYGTSRLTPLFEESLRTERDYGNLVKASLRGYTGVRITPGRHLIVGADLGLWMHFEYQARTGNGNLMNFLLQAPAFRAMAGWRF